jgi:nucleotide-binding universal stress UspA family protein
MNTILAAVDFSDAARPVIASAAGLAHALSARIILLHIVEPVTMQLPVQAGEDAISAVAWPLRAPKGLKARLDSLALPLRTERLDVKPVAHVGLVVEGILEHSAGYHAELILLGCHGHLAAQHVLSGNVLMQVVKQAPCPVIVVPVKWAASGSEARSGPPNTGRSIMSVLAGGWR